MSGNAFFSTFQFLNGFSDKLSSSVFKSRFCNYIDLNPDQYLVSETQILHISMNTTRSTYDENMNNNQ